MLNLSIIFRFIINHVSSFICLLLLVCLSVEQSLFDIRYTDFGH